MSRHAVSHDGHYGCLGCSDCEKEPEPNAYERMMEQQRKDNARRDVGEPTLTFTLEDQFKRVQKFVNDEHFKNRSSK